MKKTIETLSASIKAIQADIVTLKGEATQSGRDSHAGSQNSDLVPGNGPAKKRKRTDLDDGSDADDDDEDGESELGDTETELYQLSEAAGAFIETTFKSKLDNATRKARATKYGMPDSRWLKCPKLDPVISTTVSTSAR